MAKLRPGTNDEINALVEQGFDASQLASDYEKRISRGYCEEISEPLRKAIGLLSASRALADLAAVILFKASLKEQKNEILTKFAAREK